MQDWAVKYWVRLGLPRSKLMLGIPAFGRTWTLQHSLEHSVGSPALSAGNPGIYTRESGLLSFYEVHIENKNCKYKCCELYHWTNTGIFVKNSQL